MEGILKDFLKFQWFKRVYILYIFGFVANFTPANPFSYEYLVTYQNEAIEDIKEDIFSIAIYSTPVAAFLLLFLIDLCNFNVIITLSSIFGIISTCLSIWGDTVFLQQLAQIFYGGLTAAEIAYYTSIYCHCDVQNYTKYTAIIRATPLTAKCLSSLLAQLLIGQKWLDYKELLYINLSFLVLATILSVFLPRIESQSNKSSSKSKQLLSNLSHSFPNKYVVKWSLWMALTFCGYNQAKVYIQPLWNSFQSEDESTSRNLNGAVEGTFSFFSLFAVILAGFSNFDWKYTGDLILSLTSLVQAFTLILSSQLESAFLSYLFYIVYGYMYHFVLTMLSAETAKFLQKGTFGIVFAFILLLGSTINSILVYLVIDRLDIDSRQEFMVYGYYHFAVSIIFVGVGLGYWFAKHTYR